MDELKLNTLELAAIVAYGVSISGSKVVPGDMAAMGWSMLEEEERATWRSIADAVLMASDLRATANPVPVFITLVEDEREATEEEVQQGIARRRTLWAGYVPINGQVSVVLPAHETLRPYSNLCTVLAIQAYQPAVAEGAEGDGS